MTVREKMDLILNDAEIDNLQLLDCDIYNLDYRQQGIIQNIGTGQIIVVYESKDDIDNEGIPQIVKMEYQNLKEFLDDYPPTY
ncbi:hypothetical protein [Chryseobacterium indologenes]|uniref:hypothetical protein n=1 Tax=Chryseobacterium indologenes TaxID=253 RepID=UPI0009A1A665|nr:hypothetical protein [Chryseobacterium indologenes]